MFELNDKLHQFHYGISRELYKRYVIMDPKFGVAHALKHGILGVEEVREDLVNVLGNLLDSDVAKKSWARSLRTCGEQAARVDAARIAARLMSRAKTKSMKP